MSQFNFARIRIRSLLGIILYLTIFIFSPSLFEMSIHGKLNILKHVVTIWIFGILVNRMSMCFYVSWVMFISTIDSNLFPYI